MKFHESLATKFHSSRQIKAKVRYFCPGYHFISHFLTGISTQTFIWDLSELMSTFPSSLFQNTDGQHTLIRFCGQSQRADDTHPPPSKDDKTCS